MTALERVGVNLLYLLPARGGMETASRRLIGAMVEERPETALVVYADREAIETFTESEPWADEVRFVTSPVSARNKAKRIAAELSWLPVRSRRDGVQVLHSHGNTGPVRARVPMVTTIHDLLYRRYPNTHARSVRIGLDLLVPRAARAATRVIAPSEATKSDLVEELGLPASKVDVVPMGPGRPPGEPVPESWLREALDLGCSPIVLSIAVGFEHKNLQRLLEAFAGVLNGGDAVLLQLGVVTSYEEPALRATAERLGIADRVRFVDRIDDAMLDATFSAATVLVHPSLMEGFGLPPLEAMMRGCAVACSNVSSLPEVVGDAAELFDPLVVPEIRDAIIRLLEDDEHRSQLIARGRKRAECFSWNATAQATFESLARAVSESTKRE